MSSKLAFILWTTAAQRRSDLPPTACHKRYTSTSASITTPLEGCERHQAQTMDCEEVQPSSLVPTCRWSWTWAPHSVASMVSRASDVWVSVGQRKPHVILYIARPTMDVWMSAERQICQCFLICRLSPSYKLRAMRWNTCAIRFLLQSGFPNIVSVSRRNVESQRQQDAIPHLTPERCFKTVKASEIKINSTRGSKPHLKVSRVCLAHRPQW